MSALFGRFIDRARTSDGRVGAIAIGDDGSEALSLDPDGALLGLAAAEIAGAEPPDLPLELVGGA